MNRSACVDRLNRRCFGEPVMQPAARLVVVEDEFLVAMQIEAILTSAPSTEGAKGLFELSRNVEFLQDIGRLRIGIDRKHPPILMS